MTIGEEVTVGNLLTLATVVVGGVIAWQKTRSQSDEHDRRIETLERELAEFRDRSASIEAMLAAIKADIGWIKTTIDRHGHRDHEERN